MATSHEAWVLIVEDAPMQGGGRCQIIQCPKGDFAVLPLPTTIFRLAGSGGTYPCLTCGGDYSAPAAQE